MTDFRLRRVPTAATIVAVSLLGLAACATPSGPAAVDSPSASPSAPTQTPAAPTETPTAPAETPSAPAETPTAVPALPTQEPGPDEPGANADIATWAISEEGIGPFRIGMAWGEAVEVAEQLGWDTSAAGDQAGCAPNVRPEPRDGDLSLYIWKGESVVYDITLTDDGDAAQDAPRPKTEDGLTVSSTVDEVRAAHPGASEGNVMPSGERPFLTVDDDGRDGRLHFEHAPEEDVITGISVNRIDQPAYEHC
ncbi:hypothetical protein [Microbacterium sp. JZ31]|uniref:hypothetical protein n=1 Tax=Microbacterium sp. JZ31 TaxID=1906274 RepID=UPI0019316BAF|nr:hypothetical protein [Microbacterium sp. JZ31]